MADVFVQSCFAFDCTEAEFLTLRECFDVAVTLGTEDEPDAPSTRFLSLFPPEGNDPWASFLALFDDPVFPQFGAELSGSMEDSGEAFMATVSADLCFEPMAVARLLQRCCQMSLAKSPIGFEWSVTCSRQRIDEFGGGWCAVFSDRIECTSTSEALSRVLNRGLGSGSNPDAVADRLPIV